MVRRIIARHSNWLGTKSNQKKTNKKLLITIEVHVYNNQHKLNQAYDFT